MKQTTITIQVIKTYQMTVTGDDPIAEAHKLSTTQIEADGKLLEATTDYVEIVEDELQV